MTNQQLERDKINTFWEITKRQLETVRAEIRNKDREVEEVEERHAVEIKVYKQKVKHLLYEHQNRTTELKTDGTSMRPRLCIKITAANARVFMCAFGITPCDYHHAPC